MYRSRPQACQPRRTFRPRDAGCSLTSIGCCADAANMARMYASAPDRSGSSSGRSMVPATDRIAAGSTRPEVRASPTIRSSTSLTLPRAVRAACARSHKRLSSDSVIDIAFRMFVVYTISLLSAFSVAPARRVPQRACRSSFGKDPFVSGADALENGEICAGRIASWLQKMPAPDCAPDVVIARVAQS